MITRDRRIAQRSRERQLVEESGGRLIAVTSKDQLTNFQILEIVMSQWHWIERKPDDPGPFIWTITRTTRTQIL